MPKTVAPEALTATDFPCAFSRENSDGTITLYYEGETPPPLQFAVTPNIVLTPRQFLQALTRANLRDAVEHTIAAADQDTKDWYYRATEFESSHPVLLAMAAALGKTQADIIALFELGQTL